MSNGSPRRISRILAVIVLYKLSPEDSVSFVSLQRALGHVDDARRWTILFFDNTPSRESGISIPDGVLYESRGQNLGLAAAYNRAIEIAQEIGCDWLLTLDQDTDLPDDFAMKLDAAIAYASTLENVAAVVPRIADHGRVISPNALTLKLLPKFFPQEFVGIALDGTTSAVNSAAALRISALRALGGYDPRFWLDYSDAVMFQRLQRAGFRIFIAGNIQVEHELSVLNIKERVSVERYRDILGAESAFWDEYMGIIALPALLLRFAYRIFYKFGRTGGSLPYFKITVRFALNRLFCSKKRRLQMWQESVHGRLRSIEPPEKS